MLLANGLAHKQHGEYEATNERGATKREGGCVCVTGNGVVFVSFWDRAFGHLLLPSAAQPLYIRWVRCSLGADGAEISRVLNTGQE